MSRDDDRGRGRDRDGPPNVDTMFTLKVDNISFRTTPESLREKFSPYGDIGDVYIPRNFGTNEPRGFAFVRFVDKRDAEDAQRALDGAEVDGREIRIQEAKERRPENPKAHMASRGGYGGGRDSYRGAPEYYRGERDEEATPAITAAGTSSGEATIGTAVETVEETGTGSGTAAMIGIAEVGDLGTGFGIGPGPEISPDPARHLPRPVGLDPDLRNLKFTCCSDSGWVW
eukprot:CAMPEP_0201093154 /NCGR_PEP_ID=MMETSP0812-20130820/1717_1 /ASSEMBLY_ACC=CAM_ASM_000668 /TAXON_ID=98059 /ORGANISM="Dinobryon sp., Strain UTEXLB2267" /LENGTH=228 /DNA_ID=CAMNT_0047345187 /DNA_START=13 /DNA_END=697 /DNA_ORIENTATION=-